MCKETYHEELAHRVTEAEQLRPRRAAGVLQSESEGLRTRKTSGETSSTRPSLKA